MRRSASSALHNRVVQEAIPTEAHLARSALERVDLYAELRGVKEGAVSRHKAALLKPEPIVAEKRTPIFGAPRRERRARSEATLPPAVSSAAQEEALRKPPTPKRRQAGGFNLSELPDPTKLPNWHEPLHDAINDAIVRQEMALEKSQLEAEMRLRQASSVTAPAFRWDKLPHHHAHSENQGQYFPKSIAKLKEFGGGKDPRFCRPYDDEYKYREAIARQKDCSLKR